MDTGVNGVRGEAAPRLVTWVSTHDTEAAITLDRPMVARAAKVSAQKRRVAASRIAIKVSK